MATYIKNKTTGNWEKSGWNGVLSFGFTGCVVPFAGKAEKVPAHWLICDGSAVGRTEYPDLFDCIGETYGAGDGSTTFNLPDFRECALVGAGQNSTDTMEAHDVYNVGEFKDDQFQGHQHKLGAGLVNYVTTTNGLGDGSHPTQMYGSTLPNTNGIVSDGTNGTPRVGNVTRGKRKGVNYIIHI